MKYASVGNDLYFMLKVPRLNKAKVNNNNVYVVSNENQKQNEPAKVSSDLAMASLGVHTPKDSNAKVYDRVEKWFDETFKVGSLREEGIERIYDAIVEDADPETIEKRIETVSDDGNKTWAIKIALGKVDNGSFILDNIEDFSAIFVSDASFALGCYEDELFSSINNKEDLEKLKAYSSDPEKFEAEVVKMLNNDEKTYEYIEELVDKKCGKGIVKEEGIERLYSAIVEDADPETIEKRIETVFDEENSQAFRDIVLGRVDNGAFILDNIDSFNEIFNEGKLFGLGPDEDKIKSLINSQEDLESLQKHVDNRDKLQKAAMKMLYDSKEHNVEYGDETVEVDSKLLVHLLTGLQYADDDGFNNAVESITEKSHRDNGDLHYNQIVEGIIRQNPELIDISSSFVDFCKTLDGLNKDEILQKIDEFFEVLNEQGVLPEKIELQTVVPDKNALICPSSTFSIMNEIVER